MRFREDHPPSFQNGRRNLVIYRHILSMKIQDDDVIKWKNSPRYWPFVRRIQRSPVNSPRKGQWRRALIFSLICAWTNGWANNRDAGDLSRHRAHYNVTVMQWGTLILYSAMRYNTIDLKQKEYDIKVISLACHGFQINGNYTVCLTGCSSWQQIWNWNNPNAVGRRDEKIDSQQEKNTTRYKYWLLRLKLQKVSVFPIIYQVFNVTIIFYGIQKYLYQKTGSGLFISQLSARRQFFEYVFIFYIQLSATIMQVG